MNVTVEIQGSHRWTSLPESERWIDVQGQCPACNSEEFRVIGDVTRQKIGHDTVKAPALALCCGAEVGEVHVELSTIFGLEEDERVLHGRARVY
jgi:hypothetical protein